MWRRAARSRPTSGRPEIRSWTVIATAGLVLLLAAPVVGQSHGETPVPTTREQLKAKLDQLQEVVQSRPSEERVRDARERIEVIRRRLAHGDFQPGDVVRLTVRTDSTLTGTFRVDGEQHLVLPTVPDADLSGVLYAEADSVMREHLGEYIRDPDVRVQVTRRFAVLGAVQNPGLYDLAPSTTLSDALMEAGGPTGDAQLENIKLRRNGKNVLEGRNPNLQRMTLAELGPSQDDQLVVPRKGAGFGAMEALGVLSTLSGIAWGLTRVF